MTLLAYSRLVRGLYELAIECLSTDARLAVVQQMAEYTESSRREGWYAADLGLVPCMGLDPNFTVVSTSALNLAVLGGPEKEDAEAGRRLVLSYALEAEDLARRSHRDPSEQGVGDGYHRHPDLAGLAVPGGGYGSVLA